MSNIIFKQGDVVTLSGMLFKYGYEFSLNDKFILKVFNSSYDIKQFPLYVTLTNGEIISFTNHGYYDNSSTPMLYLEQHEFKQGDVVTFKHEYDYLSNNIDRDKNYTIEVNNNNELYIKLTDINNLILDYYATTIKYKSLCKSFDSSVLELVKRPTKFDNTNKAIILTNKPTVVDIVVDNSSYFPISYNNRIFNSEGYEFINGKGLSDCKVLFVFNNKNLKAISDLFDINIIDYNNIALKLLDDNMMIVGYSSNISYDDAITNNIVVVAHKDSNNNLIVNNNKVSYFVPLDIKTNKIITM